MALIATRSQSISQVARLRRLKTFGSNSSQAGRGTLKIRGGPHNEFAFRIEVPRETDLFVRMPFGDLKLDEIRGNKNIELHAGELNVAMGNPRDYARIDASVYTGEINSAALSLSKRACFARMRMTVPGNTSSTLTLAVAN